MFDFAREHFVDDAAHKTNAYMFTRLFCLVPPQKEVFVQLQVDNSTFLFEDRGTNERKIVALEEILSIADKSDSITSLEIVTRKQRISLQAGSLNEKQDWVGAAA